MARCVGPGGTLGRSLESLRMGLSLVTAACSLGVAASGAVPLKVLFVGSADNPVGLGLRTLDIPCERRMPDELKQVSLFGFDLVVWGMDVPRDVLNSQRDAVLAFVESGGVILGFRCKTVDESWLPVPLQRDRGFAFGEILLPEHPVFTRPHRLTDAIMRTVHDAGSIYNAFSDLGPGWVPLATAGTPLHWDKREARSSGPHYGIVELLHGTGRILLLDMIPAYNWFRDCAGDPQSPGAMLFTNLLTYAREMAPRRAAVRPPPEVPDALVSELSSLWRLPQRDETIGFDGDMWHYETVGPYSVNADRRGVLAMRHADVPSTADNRAGATARLALPQGGQRYTLQWYESDTYCGGVERVLGGPQHGQAALRNYKRGHRFKEVLVNGEVVWEADVLGRNPQPTSRRFHRLDITERIPPGARDCEVTFRVVDRQGSADLPFAIEVYYGRVHIDADTFQCPAGAILTGAGVSEDAAGQLQMTGPEAVLSGRLELPAGRYRLGLRLHDGAYGRSEVRLRLDGGEPVVWRLTADDHRFHWFVTPLLDVSEGKLTVELQREGEETPAVAEIAAFPERLLQVSAAEPGDRVPPMPTPADTLRFTATVAESAGVAREGEIAVQTFPFAQGSLRSVDRLRVLDPAGRELPVQTRPVASWPDGSLKVVATAFPVTLAASGRRTVQVEAGQGIPVGRAHGSLVLSEEEGRIVLDTGVIRAVLSTERGTLYESIRRGDRWLAEPGRLCELVLEDEQGRTVHSSASAVTATEIVERGPLRALIVRRGRLALDGDLWVDYRLQVEATAGADVLRCQAFIINRSDAEEIYLKRWSLQVQHSGDGSGRIWLGEGESVTARPGDLLYQHREDTLTWTGAAGARQRAAGRAPGVVRLPGMALGTRWFWQRFPQAIQFAAGVLRQDFIPQALDEGDLPSRWAARMAERTDAYTVGGVGYPQSPGKMGLFRFARGQALRQEIVFAFDGQDIDGPTETLRATLNARLRAAVEPQYVSATRVYGTVHPADPLLYPAYEASVEHFLQAYLGKREARREYGFENYGDDTFEWGYGPSHTYWSNCEYDHHHGFALQYLRSGDPRWWEEFEAAARLYADVVVIHHEPQDSPRPQLGGPRHHNYTALWMESHPEQPWVADHTMKPADSGHAWAEGVVDTWFLTGDPWAGEVLQNVVQWYCRIVEENRYGAGGQERGPGWALVALSALVRATDDPRAVAAGRQVAEWVTNWQDPVRGVVSVPISEQPSYEGGTVFMHGIVGRGLGHWYDVSGDPAVREALIRLADWLVTEPMDAPGKFWYKQAPRCMTAYRPTTQTVSALAYAAEFTGDPLFAEVATTLIAGDSATVRSLSWYPEVLEKLAATRRPVDISLGSADVVMLPGETVEAPILLRNTIDEPVTVALAVDLAGPFRVTRPEPLELAPGATATLAVSLTCDTAPASGSLQGVLTLSPRSGPPVQRHVALSLRSIGRASRISLDLDSADIRAPMTLVKGAEEDPYVDSPRPADFSGSPLPLDSPGCGAATWEFVVKEAETYTLWTQVRWLDGKGNSFHLQLDDAAPEVLGNSGDVGVWLWVRGPQAPLPAGVHRLRISTREEGAQLRRLWLSSSPDDRPAGLVAE